MYYTFLIDRGKRFYSEEMQKVFHKKGGKPDKLEPFFKHRLEEAWSWFFFHLIYFVWLNVNNTEVMHFYSLTKIWVEFVEL